MNFKELFRLMNESTATNIKQKLLQERDDFQLAYTVNHLAKYWIEDLLEWLKNVETLPYYMTEEQWRDVIIEYYKKIKYIHTTDLKIPVLIKKSMDGRSVRGSAELDEKDWSAKNIGIYDRTLFNKKQQLEYQEGTIHLYKPAAKELYDELNKQKDELITTIGHELVHIFRYEKDVVGDKDQKTLDKTMDDWRKQHGYIWDEKLQKYVYHENKDILLKKYRKDLNVLFHQTKNQIPWYRFLKYMKFKDDFNWKKDTAKFGSYANEFDEIDARFIEAIFPTIRKTYSSFDELKKEFIQTIADDYWDTLLPKHKQRIMKRLYQYYESKK